MDSVLVLSGVSTRADLAASPARPSVVMADILELTEWLNAV
jgi:ribonucleotide monophosphatase NagD (HAD superfamily)